VCLITGLTVYLLCRLFCIDFALFWALLAFLLHFIPVAGAIVAGGFGYHLRAASLARIGLVPAEWTDRVRFAGNTALAGARMALVNSAARLAAESLAGSVRTIDLAADPRFQERFLAALSFPE
jgi:uncharacterized 2Fe-2S/4Fe-4S cluster protein (DUF4445 family)